MHWVFGVVTDVVLPDSGDQLDSSFYQYLCTELGLKKLFTEAYHAHIEGKVERFYRTILPNLQAFCEINEKVQPEYVNVLTLTYNLRVNLSIGIAPFEIVLSNPPGGHIIRKEPIYKYEHMIPKEPEGRSMKAVHELGRKAPAKLLASRC